MPAAEARIPTPRAVRYLDQLTSHTGHMRSGHFGGRHRPDGAHVAPDSADLERGQDLLTHRVRTIGRREDLTVTWSAKDETSS